jgi:DNA modification methylase
VGGVIDLVNNKNSIILNEPAENVDWLNYKNKEIDLVFTSPPYFNTEYYAKNTKHENNQSWFKYNEYEKWRDLFLLKTLKNVGEILVDDGIIAINIIDITINGKTYNICEDIYNFMIPNGFTYMGYVGMRMKQRPKNINESNNKEYMSSYYVEPIWMFRKKIIK